MLFQFIFFMLTKKNIKPQNTQRKYSAKAAKNGSNLFLNNFNNFDHKRKRLMMTDSNAVSTCSKGCGVPGSIHIWALVNCL